MENRKGQPVHIPVETVAIYLRPGAAEDNSIPGIRSPKEVHREVACGRPGSYCS